MKSRITWIALAALCTVGVGTAQAAMVAIPQPDASYLASTTKIPITAADYSTVSSLSDGDLTVSFGIPLAARTVPSSWATWSSPPDSEEATPRVLQTQGASGVTLTFDRPVALFGVEMEPNKHSLYTMSAVYYNGASVVGSISRLVDGDAGARLFAASTDEQFTSVVLSTEAGSDGFALAQVRYATGVIPEPATLLLFGTGVAGVWLRRRRRSRAS